MRIIAGEARGRHLFAPAGLDTRPTADRIRESLFNILQARIPGAHVLDLFGGTGALALESISRGADRATIVDSDRRAIAVISRNAQIVAGDGYESRIAILQADYRKAIAALAKAPFDLVFVDPPYRMAGAYTDAANLLMRSGLLAKDAVLVFERARAAQIDCPAGLRLYDTRLYGETAVDFLTEATIA